MAAPRAAWGLEIGADALKAIRLERDGDTVAVADFAYIPHKKSLATPDLDPNDMIRLSLGQFMSQKDLEREHLVVSVPGHEAFARFAKLPPVENVKKQLADIVRFEAQQQIPFPIDEVEWDYEVFQHEGLPDMEVGIFAMKRDRVAAKIELYGDLGMTPEAMTLSPVALYNGITFDLDLEESSGPLAILDIGTMATDVVIAEQGRCWIRTFPLGGTHFTEAIAKTFKLSYSQAEKLKKEAGTSKYAKQIMQAMRPVFSDLLQDLQRSLSYYQQMHRDSELEEMLGVGSTFKIPGLRKFIGQQLQLNVQRLDEYKKITVTGREASSFAEHAVNLGTAYGLALQGIGLAPIAANLVPAKALRESMWANKTKWFAAAAAVFVAGAATTLYHPLKDRGALAGSEPPVVQSSLGKANRFKNELNTLTSSEGAGFSGINMMRLVEDRAIYPFLIDDATRAIAASNPQAALLSGNRDAAMQIDPKVRRQVILQQWNALYGFDPQAKKRSFDVTMNVELTHDNPVDFLNETVADWLRENAERDGVPYRIIPDSVRVQASQLDRTEVDDAGNFERKAPSRTGGSSGGNGNTGGNNPAIGNPAGRGRGGGGGGQRRPPGPGGAGGGGGNGDGLGMTGSSGRQRDPNRQQRRPPGPGGDSTGGNNPAPGLGRPTGSGRQLGGERPARGGNNPAGGDNESVDLNALAPLPPAPSMYPPGTSVYSIPITFTVEMIEPGAPRPPATASRNRTGGGNDGQEQSS